MSEALWHVDATRSELRPSAAPDDPSLVPVRARYSMVSTGTERLVALGLVPPAAAGVMAVPYMAGNFTFPIKYGYSLVGTDPDGRAAHCLHPHEATAWVEAADLVSLPGLAPLDRMALVSNLETAINATWDAGVARGDDALVCGFGTVGALLALTLRLMHGVEPVVVERDGYRAGIARDLGFETHSGDEGVDPQRLLFNTSGTGSGLQWCLDHAAMEATVVELGWYGDTAVPLMLGAQFHFNRVRIVSSQVGAVAASKRDTVTHIERRRIAADLLTDAAFDALPRTRVPLAEAPRLFDALRAGKLPDGLIWLIDYGDQPCTQ